MYSIYSYRNSKLVKYDKNTIQIARVTDCRERQFYTPVPFPIILFPIGNIDYTLQIYSNMF